MSELNFGRRHQYFELFFLLLPSSAKTVATVPTLQRMLQFKYQSYHAKSLFAVFFKIPYLLYDRPNISTNIDIASIDDVSSVKILVVYMTSWKCSPFQTTLCKSGINTPASFQIFVSGEKVLATQYISADVERHRVETKIFISPFSRKFLRKFIYTFCEIYSPKLKMQNRLFSCSEDPCWKTIPRCSTPQQQTLCYHQAR